MKHKMMIANDASESVNQQAVITWSRWNVSKYPELALLHAIPNGGARAKKTAGILKAEGTLPGIPDLHLPVARGGYHSLYIEMKKHKGRLSDAQTEVIPLLQAEGNRVDVCFGWEEAIAVLVNYLSVVAKLPVKQ